MPGSVSNSNSPRLAPTPAQLGTQARAAVPWNNRRDSGVDAFDRGCVQTPSDGGNWLLRYRARVAEHFIPAIERESFVF